ncbi:28S ribosomal protein S18c, mitochondrial [Macrosteles quadrilineatus]|uniref:28S ribosomal protein S18c, mitochondrial n=1 Tax=Macrosteles quadrilineatus TaxID=74068 RepID=UPI0023E199A5|nr:28S ribosomal protein S18c, mitochondrial [Macrosteles quadrilineatus]
MSLLNRISSLSRVFGTSLQLKPLPRIISLASCSTSSCTGNHNHSEDSNNDAPVDIENPFRKEKRLCILCKMNISPDYKNVKLLSQFVSMYTGKIYGRHITGLCTKRQQQVENEIIKAQNAGLMPYYLKDPAFMQDPQLFNPENPFRNHPY